MRYQKVYRYLLAFAGVLALLGLLLDRPENIPGGLWKILITEDSLITDYVAIAGPGAAFVNAALVTAVSVLVLRLAKESPNGYTLVEIGLMAGFALFGKNIMNIWPIILGAWLYAKARREPFSRYASVALLATSLAPVVSFLCLSGNGWTGWVAGILVGAGIGFILPPLSAYTFRIQNGMNLYNMGFACGLLAMMLVPVLSSLGHAPTTAHHWATGYDLPLGLALGGLCAFLILSAFLFTKKPAWSVWAGYRRLLQTTGRAPSDYLRMFGHEPVLMNMGVNGLIGMAFILLSGGDLNGPTLGGIFTIMGFSAFGKHARNIVPVMFGVFLGSLLMQWSIHDSAVQLACLFCTTLAPISGYFGWPFGVLAGFLHSSVVLHAGTPVEGINLYNNGFSGGLIAIVLYPIITSAIRHRRPVIQDEDYFDALEEDAPITPPPPMEEKHSGEEPENVPEERDDG